MGIFFNIESKYKLANINKLSNQVGVFYDRGKAYMANNTVGFKSRSIQDIGLSYYASYKNFSAKTQLAWTINSETPTETKAGNSRLLFQGIWTFKSPKPVFFFLKTIILLIISFYFYFYLANILLFLKGL